MEIVITIMKIHIQCEWTADCILHLYERLSIIQNVLLFHSTGANATKHCCALAHACEDIVTCK